MTFEEFFKKKRIDLAALEKAEPVLFSEFKAHFEQMGEKSFDHTKKYWFNKIRRQYPLAPEIKTEKPHIANPLAEQTITEGLTEPVPASALPKVGFVPKFRAAAPPKPAAENTTEAPVPPPNEPAPEPTDDSVAKPAYVPRFKAPPKPAAPESAPEPAAPPSSPENTAAKPAYVPRFKMKPKEETDESKPAEATIPAPEAETPPAPKPAYKPRFVPPKPKE